MSITAITLDDILIAQRVTLPNTIARAGWQIVPELLDEAQTALHLELPIFVRYTAGRSRVGCHYARSTGHHITLSQDRSLEFSNTTLWHELAHAWQSQQFANQFGKPITKFYREAYTQTGRGYSNNPYELHAQKFAAANEHNKLLRQVR